MIRLAIINAATSPHRHGRPLARWIAQLAERNGAFVVDEIDLRALDLPFFDEPALPRYRQYAHDHTREWSRRVEQADAFVIVSPEYNRGYSALLKNALDYLAHEWAYKPVGIVSYGASMTGGLRGAEALRTVLSALQMYPLRGLVLVPFIADHVRGEEFLATEGMLDGAEVMMDELVRAHAAMHILRAPEAEVGDHQGQDGDADAGGAAWRPPEMGGQHQQWQRVSPLERPPGFV